MSEPLRVTVWNENVHEREEDDVRARYPDGLHGAIASGLSALLGDAVAVRTATLEEPEHGLTDAVLAETDVLTWWGHQAHDEVTDLTLDRVHARVLDGMGLIVLHSGHFSRIFKRLMGPPCDLMGREAGERERIWVVDPGHPIAAGLGESFVIDHEEMYGEHFDIPPPDELVFINSYEGGEVFRGGCCWYRGLGRVAYFSPGDQEYPVYHQLEVQRVIANCVAWAGGADKAGKADKPNDVPSARKGSSKRNWYM